MSKEELQALRDAQEANKKHQDIMELDDQSGKVLPEIPVDIEPVIRIKVRWVELLNLQMVKGAMKFDANQVDDFVIARGNGIPTYNFVVAIDDHLMGITDVIRVMITFQILQNRLLFIMH